ncbi:MAG: hypothetical protein ACEQSN_15015 [Yersinia sp. (in: enterobacteria)]
MRRRDDVDYLLELWARWIQNGCNEGRSGFASMLEMMMVTRCQFSGGGGGSPRDEIETGVEAAVMALTAEDAKAALILRIEYGAWEIRTLDCSSTQLEKAHALSLTLRTYKRKLAKSRSFVADFLEKRKSR